MKSSLISIVGLGFAGWARAGDVLSTNGFQNCGTNSNNDITVQNLDISFDRSNSTIVFNVAGTNTVSQEVTVELIVSAYGLQVYNNSFDPCAESTKVAQLCPLPAGHFSAVGSQQIPSSYADRIPSIAYTVPDLDGDAQMILKAKDGSQVACIQSSVTNGKSFDVPAVSYVVAAVAAVALVISAVGALAAAGHPGTTSSSPGFTEVIWYFQGLAFNGMLSVDYPIVYRSFTKNFAFSTGLIPWSSLQTSIDSFRASTGGNLTDNNYQYLRNVTLVYSDSTSSRSSTKLLKRALDGVSILTRQSGITTSLDGSSTASTASSFKQSKVVSGIQGYVEALSIPDANVFMNVLLAFAIIVAVIVVGILLLKVILEAWSLIGRYPKSLVTFRKEYWRIMAQTITQLILLLYGSWTLYCIYQFTHGDSWAAKTLAAVTLGLFTAVLGFYTWKIWSHVQKIKRQSGGSAELFENKATWKKYSLFYSSYKTTYWWLFMPTIVYMFAKGCVLAAGDGHGMVQTIGQLVIECLMLILLLWGRPFNRRSGNWINIVIQVVRVISIGLILVFVAELGIQQTTKTITGVVLIVVQASLTAILAILIAINAIISCCRENPHRRRRKAAEKANQMASRDLEGDAFLMETAKGHRKDNLSGSTLNYDEMRTQAQNDRFSRYGLKRGDSQDVLVAGAAPIAQKGDYHAVPGSHRDESPPRVYGGGYSDGPRLPDLQPQYGGYR